MTLRTDVTEILYEDMSPELRAMVAYEHSNGVFNVAGPQIAFDRLREETPVLRWDFGVGFFTMEDVIAAARNPAIVSNDPVKGVPFGMGSEEPLIPLHFDGDLHRRFRKLLDPLFAPRKMAGLEAQVRTLADNLVDGFAAEGQAEMFSRFCVPLPSTFFLRLFGMPLEDLPSLNTLKDRILKNDGGTMEDKEAIGLAAGHDMRLLLRRRLDDRKASGSRFDDLLDSFIHFELDGDRLTDDEVVNIMHMFTIAGLDTVTSSLSCILAWLATHPDLRHGVLADPSLIAPTVEELMRFESPVPVGGPRWAREDTEINGVPVKAGELVFLCWASANLDPSSFDRPLDVDIDRPENRHIAFAAGFHRCLGSHLARIEIRTALDQFHRRVDDYELASGEQIRYELGGVRQANYLPLVFTPV